MGWVSFPSHRSVLSLLSPPTCADTGQSLGQAVIPGRHALFCCLVSKSVKLNTQIRLEKIYPRKRSQYPASDQVFGSGGNGGLLGSTYHIHVFGTASG
jgi:hypothetical protein